MLAEPGVCSLATPGSASDIAHSHMYDQKLAAPPRAGGPPEPTTSGSTVGNVGVGGLPEHPGGVDADIGVGLGASGGSPIGERSAAGHCVDGLGSSYLGRIAVCLETLGGQDPERVGAPRVVDAVDLCHDGERGEDVVEADWPLDPHRVAAPRGLNRSAVVAAPQQSAVQ